MKRTICIILMAAAIWSVQAQSWPEAMNEAKPGTRWWWHGSAVDKENLRWLMQQYGSHGIGAVEITPVDAIQGNQANNIPYLSDRWMEMLREVQQNAEGMQMEVGMATGTGWPFGGPWVPLEESACKVVFVEGSFSGHQAKDLELNVPEGDRPYSRLSKVMAYSSEGAFEVTSCMNNGRLSWTAPEGTKEDEEWQVIALYVRYGVLKVKRAAPGGEGWVIDHFDSASVAHYLSHIEEAFERTGTPYPHTFFNDSYEVNTATWTPRLFAEFEKRRGYKLEEFLPELIGRSREKGTASRAREEVVSDYRETLSDLLLENFTMQWTAWAHKHGAITRNQAHGSPSNLIDCYAAVDIPEIEGFGLSELGIKGLRTDPGKTRPNDSDYSMMKYAPSAAHICGKPFTSSETFTWLTEHFRTSLSQLKPDLDLMFCAGVNHIFFHGTAYSPKDDAWPGWKFYASIDMSPTNSIWRDAPFFMQYVTRCQSFLQWGQPDNDFLVLLPVRDMWRTHLDKMLMMFTIHDMRHLAPQFIETILAIERAGFDCDYISERLLLNTAFRNGQLTTQGGTTYRALIVPGSGRMSDAVAEHIESLKAQGATVLYDTDAEKMGRVARSEPMKAHYGLKAIRRRNPTGYHYFIANLSPNDVSATVPLSVPFRRAAWFNPLDGTVEPAQFDQSGIAITLSSGESRILQTWDDEAGVKPSNSPRETAKTRTEIPLEGPWKLSFTEEAPHIGKTFLLDSLQTWETLEHDSLSVMMGTGVYETRVKLTGKQLPRSEGRCLIDLGDVRESARVYINGSFVGCAWSVPFRLDCSQSLRSGWNEIRIEVTNLPANRIRDLDRRQVKWRKMEGINVVDINYKHTTYDQWELVPSGLNSEVKLILLKD
ncbi:MAG: glycosyl hydrolase family 2 [Bacteroidaceae bacterium]|nr:glycosyl hydrolase family 2 [Bacteroidaceae bacterium]